MRHELSFVSAVMAVSLANVGVVRAQDGAAGGDATQLAPARLTERQQLLALEQESYELFVDGAQTDAPPQAPAPPDPEVTAAASREEEIRVGTGAVARLASRLDPREAMRTARALATRAVRATEAHRRAVQARQQATENLLAAERAAEDETDPRRRADIVSRAQRTEREAADLVGRSGRASDEANAALVERLDPERAAIARARAIEEWQHNRERAARVDEEVRARTASIEAQARASIQASIAAIEGARAVPQDEAQLAARRAALVAAINALLAARTLCNRWANAVDDSEVRVHPACRPTWSNHGLMLDGRRDVEGRAAAELARLEDEARAALRTSGAASSAAASACSAQSAAQEVADQRGTPEDLAALEAATLACAEGQAAREAAATRSSEISEHVSVLNNALADFEGRTRRLENSFY